jgi:hypothetical protein
MYIYISNSTFLVSGHGHKGHFPDRLIRSEKNVGYINTVI